MTWSGELVTILVSISSPVSPAQRPVRFYSITDTTGNPTEFIQKNIVEFLKNNTSNLH